MNGFEQINQVLWISKDPEAQLFYTFDWADWLSAGDEIDTAVYTITARINDPEPLVKESSGIQGNKTYIELSSGQAGKSYTVSVKVTTTGGLIDSRYFKVKVEPRSA
jgi:hypothetical protein